MSNTNNIIFSFQIDIGYQNPLYCMAPEKNATILLFSQ